MKTMGFTNFAARVGKNFMKYKPVAKAVRKFNKNKPEILAVTGGICIIAAFGWAIYEAVTVKDSLVESSDKVKTIEAERDAQLSVADISEEQKTTIVKTANKELATARLSGALTVAKKFVGPAVMLGVGMKMGTDGFRILRARNILLGGALKSTEDILKFYRGNVRNELGEEADKKFMRGVTGEQTVEEVKKNPDGTETSVKTTLPVVKNSSNPWRFQFNEENFDSWQEDSDLDLFYLKCEQDWWNHEYQNNDTINMYEVLKHMRFRFDKLKERMSKKEYKEFLNFLRNYGWWKGSNGDGFVDFGIYRAINEAAVRRTSDVIFVEFNCDGCLENM